MAPGRAERSEAGGLGTTKEVLGFTIDSDFKDFLGLPILLLGFPRIYIRILIRSNPNQAKSSQILVEA